MLKPPVAAVCALAPILAGTALITFAFLQTSTAVNANAAIPKPPERGLGSLKGVPVPEPANIGDFVVDKSAAVQLGKALFWDVQVGSDGNTACATCHFQAGADARTKNQLNPGPDSTFQVQGPNGQLSAADFPLHKLADANNPASVTADTNDIVGSQGVLNRQFTAPVPVTAAAASTAVKTAATTPISPADACSNVPDPIFHVGANNSRRVTGRNAPSAIDAVFNMRNFWDGRAQAEFNGVDPFGTRDTGAHVFKLIGSAVQPVQIALPFSSLASQATGPGLSPTEMSCNGRTWADVGHKLFGLTPLNKQLVDPTDSAIGALANSQKSPQATGLSVTYQSLIQKAFQPVWWQGPGSVNLNGVAYSQMEANFSLFWGLAVQEYESTLVADQTPVDQFFDGGTSTLSNSALNGMNLFVGKAKCIECHGGPELTNASVGNITVPGIAGGPIERMDTGAGGCTLYDTGFYNIGVRPTAEDPGVGGTDPYGNSLSIARMVLLGKLPDVAAATTPALGSVPNCDSSSNVDGSFKAPGLRNVELTGPYFHNGGKATLRQVVDFYSRGGDFAAQNAANLDGEIKPLGLSDQEKTDLVNFLVALTDERVRWQRGPFDHPSLCVPNGETGDTRAIQTTPDGAAADAMTCIPQTGIGGAIQPFQAFLALDPTQPTGVAPTATPVPATATPVPATATATSVPTATTGSGTGAGTTSGTLTSTPVVVPLPTSAMLTGGSGSTSVPSTTQATATSVPTSTPVPNIPPPVSVSSVSSVSSSSAAAASVTPTVITTVQTLSSTISQQFGTPVPAVVAPQTDAALTGPAGLPSSAIFAPPTSSTDASAPTSNASTLATPVFAVIDVNAGGVVGLADNSLKLVIPSGVADTDLVTVSLTEVSAGSPAANFQVGNRSFVLTVVDSGGAAITSLNAPISVMVPPSPTDPNAAVTLDPTTAVAASILALDPDSGVLVPVDASVQQDLETAGALAQIGAPLADPATDATASAAAPTPQSTASSARIAVAAPAQPGDPVSIARSLGLIP